MPHAEVVRRSAIAADLIYVDGVPISPVRAVLVPDAPVPLLRRAPAGPLQLLTDSGAFVVSHDAFRGAVATGSNQNAPELLLLIDSAAASGAWLDLGETRPLWSVGRLLLERALSELLLRGDVLAYERARRVRIDRVRVEEDNWTCTSGGSLGRVFRSPDGVSLLTVHDGAWAN